MKKIIIILLIIIVGLIVYASIAKTEPIRVSEKEVTLEPADDWVLLANGSLRFTDASGKKWTVDLSKNPTIIDRSTVGGIREKQLDVTTWIKSNTPFRLENYSGPGISPSQLFVTGTVSGNTIVATKIVDEGQ